MTPKIEGKFDVAVIGGGPAGMMAAGRAAESGARAVLVEGGRRPGVKLLMTGNGRCNLTNTGHDHRGLAAQFGKNGRFLLSAFSTFGAEETVVFFERLGVATKTETGGRVFPASDRSSDVLGALVRYMGRGGVTVMNGSRVAGLESRDGTVTTARLAGGGLVTARCYIVCTGGMSYPKTGSTGDGYGWLRGLGHTVTALTPALSPVSVRETWVRELEGASLADTVITVYRGGRKTAHGRGEAVFTRNGISGPAVLNLSGAIGEISGTGEASITLDLMPELDVAAVNARLLDVFKQEQNRTTVNCLSRLLTPKLAPLFVRLSGMDPDGRVNGVSRGHRLKLAQLTKALPMTVAGVGGFDRAMVTRGGVSLKEVDSKTMRSKLAGNLYIAGELLDLDGPSGGYNLQMCWSTGYAAGSHAAGCAGDGRVEALAPRKAGKEA